MPRQKKETILINLGNIGNVMARYFYFNCSDKVTKIKSNVNSSLPFKNTNYNSKYRMKDTHSRITKNVKNLVQDTLDSISFNTYQSIEAGPTLLPKKKYCDITGFESNYKDPKTGLRFYNSEIYKIVGTLPEPIKNQYLAMRKALFIIK